MEGEKAAYVGGFGSPEGCEGEASLVDREGVDMWSSQGMSGEILEMMWGSLGRDATDQMLPCMCVIARGCNLRLIGLVVYSLLVWVILTATEGVV